MSDDGAFYLSDVLDHPELMDAYPMLNDLKVTRSNILYDKGDEGGFFSPSEGAIYISPKMSNKDAKSVLLHEAQHAVQFLEGFAFGGTPESALKSIPDPVLFKGAKQYTKFMKSEIKRLNAKADAYDHYLNHPTIEMARDAYSISRDERVTDDFYLDMAEELGLDIYNPAHSDQLDQLDELWEALVLRTPASAKLEAGKPRRDARKKQFELAQLNKAIEDKIPATIRRIVGKDKQAQFEAYEHLYGEAEARDVQARMDMTPEERAATAPLSSEPQLDPESLISTDVFGQAASSERYMRPSRLEGFEADPEGVTQNDLFEMGTARGILESALESYEPRYRSWAEAKADARARGLNSGHIRKSKGVGELDRKMFQYDQVAQAMSERLAVLGAEIQRGNFAKDRKSVV